MGLFLSSAIDKKLLRNKLISIKSPTQNDKYQTYFGAFKGNYFVNDNLTLKLTLLRIAFFFYH